MRKFSEQDLDKVLNFRWKLWKKTLITILAMVIFIGAGICAYYFAAPPLVQLGCVAGALAMIIKALTLHESWRVFQRCFPDEVRAAEHLASEREIVN